jgi:nickel-dependent lactate racemase
MAGEVVQLPYGHSTQDLALPGPADLIEPKRRNALPDETTALVAALSRPIASRPLRDLIPPGATVGISVCDVTRPFPASRVLPVLLTELESAGAGRVTVYIATGTHRRCTPAELERMLGAATLKRCVIVQHDAFDVTRHRKIGSVIDSSTPAMVESRFLDENVRITTGFIEPHFFAGFSGGPKMVAPGLAAIETVLELHSAARIGHPDARWGVIHGNPVHDAVRAIAAAARIDFNLDVTLEPGGQITGVFAGELFESHSAGCREVEQAAKLEVSRPYDIVVTTNSGYPLDQNLYQCVKGMSAAAQIVRNGGTIIIAAECTDGMPAHGRYRELLAASPNPESFLRTLARMTVPEHDQWQTQVQAQVQRKARVLVFSGGLSEAEIRSAWLEPIEDIGATLAALTNGVERTVALLPQGPQTMPAVRAADS